MGRPGPGPDVSAALGSMIKIPKAHRTASRTRYTGQGKETVQLVERVFVASYGVPGHLQMQGVSCERAKAMDGLKIQTRTNSLAVTQHNDNKNRDPQVSFSGTVTPLKLLRHCEQWHKMLLLAFPGVSVHQLRSIRAAHGFKSLGFLNKDSLGHIITFMAPPFSPPFLASLPQAPSAFVSRLLGGSCGDRRIHKLDNGECDRFNVTLDHTE
ncbi:hypothetical protein QBC45DRAFT_401379 [Copromyces sp. CBS 386.78]|nr:hypothetical protein QBC45DRAFT_401379 [Copromyces sp. CBS 386.78]